MKENLQLKILLINKKGTSSIFSVLLLAGIIVFLILPIFAYVFDKSIVTIISQEITDEMELVTWKVLGSLSKSELSEIKVVLSDRLTMEINDRLDVLENKIVKEINLKKIQIEKKKYYTIKFSLELSLSPSLYRDLISVPQMYELTYLIELPINY